MTVCFHRRHLAGVVAIGCGVAQGWYQAGCKVEKSRYDLSQIIFMASFLDWMLSRFSPPLLRGEHRMSYAILGDESSSHMNFQIILVRAVSIVVGIPCAFVRNWVCPPITAWMIIFLPYRVGLLLPHCSRSFLILSSTGSQGAVALVWLLIHAPRRWIAVLSGAMWMSSFSGSRSCGLSFLMLWRDDLYSSVLIGTISVFSVLNLAPKTWHQWSRISWILSRLSCSVRKSMVLSANSLILGLCGVFGMSIPIISGSDLMLQASGSIARY